MKTIQIYQVYERSGVYEDRSENIIQSYVSEEKAKEHLTKLNQELQKSEEKSEMCSKCLGSLDDKTDEMDVLICHYEATGGTQEEIDKIVDDFSKQFESVKDEICPITGEKKKCEVEAKNYFVHCVDNYYYSNEYNSFEETDYRIKTTTLVL